MLALNLISWLVFTTFFYLIRKDSDASVNEVLLTNNFIPTHYDWALALLLGGFALIWLWHKFSLYFLDTWDFLAMSPAKLWALKNLGFWSYAFVGLLIAPQLIFLISVPFLFLIDKLNFHLGDYLMPLVISVTQKLILIVLGWVR